MKKLMTILVLALALCLCASAMAETVFQLGTTVNEQDSFQVAAEKFAELVAERTNGEYKIEIYPNGTLGGESEMLDSMTMGMLDMGIITSGPFVNFSAMMGVLDMPYLFATNEEAYAVLDGEIGQELLGSLEEAGLKGLAYAERGFRNVTNSVRPVTCAADLAGLKLRVMENEVYTATFKALGVNAVPMACPRRSPPCSRAPSRVRRTRSTSCTPTACGITARSTSPSTATPTRPRSSP